MPAGGMSIAMHEKLLRRFVCLILFVSSAAIMLPGSGGAEDIEAQLPTVKKIEILGNRSFDDGMLSRIGRIHSSAQAQRAVERAAQAGFERINLDLIFGLPGQSLEQACADLDQALATRVEHLSLYQLTIEPNTEFACRPPGNLPDPDLCWSMQEALQQRLKQADYQQYEVSAYTRNEPCRHNVNYWLYGDYLAVGAGAHGKISCSQEDGGMIVRRYWNHRHPKAYLQASASGRFRADESDVREPSRDFEFLMNALRLVDGFSLPLYEQRTGGREQQLLKKLESQFSRGWLEQQEANIRATAQGFRFLDSVLMELL